jgi:hypothetical protein
VTFVGIVMFGDPGGRVLLTGFVGRLRTCRRRSAVPIDVEGHRCEEIFAAREARLAKFTPCA